MSRDKAKEYAVKLIKEGEGLRLHLYDDKTGENVTQLPSGGYPTIGIGTNLGANKITLNVAKQMLYDELIGYIEELEDKVSFWNDIDYIRKAVLIDCAYNLGIGGLMKFDHLLWAIKNENWEEAMDGLYYSQYYHQVASRAIRNMMILFTGEKFNKAEASIAFSKIKDKYGYKLP